MKLYPAIDVLGGKAVRLVRGDFDAKKVYDEDPLSAATGWVADGARRLHVVDLDGAKQGSPANLEHLRRIAAETGVPVQFGGGLRSLDSVGAAFQAGAQRVVLGTAAFADPAFLADCLRHWPGQVLVSVDVRGGKVATAGWTQTIELTGAEVVGRLAEQGARELIYTNVDRDGMLEGADLDEVSRVARAVAGSSVAGGSIDESSVAGGPIDGSSVAGGPVDGSSISGGSVAGSFIYSGGIGQLADLESLAALDAPSLHGAIVGKALYERRFTVAQARGALGDL